MATKAQIAANRTNAQKSTGPTTAEGKAKSSRNAFSHGFTSVTRVIEGEDPEELKALHFSLLDELQPATTVETILVEKMSLNQWLSLRAFRLQAEAFQRLENPMAVGDIPKDLGLLIRYQAAADRAFHKAHAELLKVQKERKKSEIGFVSQNAEKPVVTTPPPAPEPAKTAPEPAAASEEILPASQIFAEYDAFEAEMAAKLGITVQELIKAA